MPSKSYMAKPGEVAAQWHLVDASGQVLGRLASRIATVLQGKHRPTYTPHVDTGDFVVVVNAEKVTLTGKKAEQKTYRRLSRRPGNFRTLSFRKVRAEHPERVISEAVRRMMPTSRLGARMLRKLKVYAGPDHPHKVHNPQPLEL